MLDENTLPSKVRDQLHTLITGPLASKQTLSYATPQYIPGHVTLWCLEVVLVVCASDIVPQKNMNELTWISCTTLSQVGLSGC